MGMQKLGGAIEGGKYGIGGGALFGNNYQMPHLK
jgi:hypothetical protein